MAAILGGRKFTYERVHGERKCATFSKHVIRPKEKGGSTCNEMQST